MGPTFALRIDRYSVDTGNINKQYFVLRLIYSSVHAVFLFIQGSILYLWVNTYAGELLVPRVSFTH